MTEDTTSTTGFISAVGQLRGPDCSGTLIGPNVVLSAGHCVENLEVTPIVYLPQAPAPGTFRVNRIDRAGDAWTNSECSSKSRSRDMALFWLETPVPPEVAEPQAF
ncbi:MAG: trypsin-like serine protease, partial [Polyangiaceae bacterium]|nr:trypsin-like serine protease [Polyangiaceae bacterium]